MMAVRYTSVVKVYKKVEILYGKNIYFHSVSYLVEDYITYRHTYTLLTTLTHMAHTTHSQPLLTPLTPTHCSHQLPPKVLFTHVQ